MLGAGKLAQYAANPVTGGFSRTAKTITLGTDHSYSTSVYKFGTASLQNDTGDYKNTFTEANTDFQIGANQDFTIEFWVYPTSLTGDCRPVLILMDDIGTTNPSGLGGGDFCFAFMIRSGIRAGAITAYIPYNAAYGDTGGGVVKAVNFGTCTQGIAANTWQYCSISRTSGVMRAHTNGVEHDNTFPTSGTDQRPMTQPTGNLPPRVWVGNSPAFSETGRFGGYIDDVRITLAGLYGQGSYTVPSAAQVNHNDTVLLAHFDSNVDDDNTSS